MKIAGIIAEYNPFHAGHAHQIGLLRSMGYDTIVSVCSPSVVQRGTLALFPSDVRTQAALAGGVDVVLCLPAPYATLSAEGFARAGVQLLTALGVCEVIAFGAETPDITRLNEMAHTLQSEAFSTALKAQLATGKSFAAARAAALQPLCLQCGDLLESPNNILAVEYCKALQLLAQTKRYEVTVPQPLALPRTGVQHDAPLHTAAQQGFASATALRALAAHGEWAALRSFVPPACFALYETAQQEGKITSDASFSVAVLSRLRQMNAVDFAQIRGMTEGLENRMAAAVQTAPDVQTLYDTLKTKRYAHARMRRLVLDAALGVTNELPQAPPYLHVLGASKMGLAALKAAQNKAQLPLSQSLAQLRSIHAACAAVAQAHAVAEDFAALCLVRPAPQGTAYTQKMRVTD